jgi:hypothetical protein
VPGRDLWDSPEPRDRAVVIDDAHALRLVVYRDDTAIAALQLEPIRAVRLANQLLGPALLRLREPPPPVDTALDDAAIFG